MANIPKHLRKYDLDNLIVSTYSIDETKAIIEKFDSFGYYLSEAFEGNSYTCSEYVTYYGIINGRSYCGSPGNSSITKITFKEFMGQDIKGPKKKLNI